jgi:hypothetical protein
VEEGGFVAPGFVGFGLVLPIAGEREKKRRQAQDKTRQGEKGDETRDKGREKREKGEKGGGKKGRHENDI